MQQETIFYSSQLPQSVAFCALILNMVPNMDTFKVITEKCQYHEITITVYSQETFCVLFNIGLVTDSCF